MHRPSDAFRQALRPSSLLVTVLLLLAVVLAVRGDLATRPIVRLEVDTGGPVAGARHPGHAVRHPDPTSSASPSRVLSDYRVRPGDTLVEIAALHGVGSGAIAALNRLPSPGALHAGQVLRIPDTPGEPTGLDVGPRSGLADLLRHAAREQHLPADLFQAVAWRESSWRQDAVSDKGAVGIGQVLPTTAAWVAQRLLGESLDPVHNVEDNARVAARYLRYLVDEYQGDVAAALAAYHQGADAVARDGWYPETVQYVSDVFRLRYDFER